MKGDVVSTMGFSRTGHGDPMILLHGLGSSRAVWDPIVPSLAERFDVIAVDLPGFGSSPPLPRGVEPTPAALAAAVIDLLNEHGIEQPHLVGNSLGGWIAVEMAKTSAARSLTLISPAGLWARDAPLYCRASLRLSRGLARHARPVLSRLVASRPGRFLVFGQMYGRPAELSPSQARGAIQGMGQCPGFDATLRATTRRHVQNAQQLTAPVTLAFGSRDVVLLKHQSRHLWALPAGTRASVLPGCGHVPMSDDPARVLDLISSAVPASPILSLPENTKASTSGGQG